MKSEILFPESDGNKTKCRIHNFQGRADETQTTEYKLEVKGELSQETWECNKAATDGFFHSFFSRAQMASPDLHRFPTSHKKVVCIIFKVEEE